MSQISFISQLQAESKLLEKANMAPASLADFVEQAVIITDLKSKIIYFNRFAEKLYGWTASEVTGKPLEEVVVSETNRQVGAQLIQRSQAGESWFGEVLAGHKSGTLFPAQVSITPIFDKEGKLTGFVALSSDITESKKAEQGLVQLASIAESCQDAIISKNLEGEIVSWNKGAENLYGYTASEAMGRPISFIVPPDRQVKMSSLLQRLKEGHSIELFETIRITKAGRPIDISLIISPLKDATGHIYGGATIARDITDRKQMELTLRQSEERFVNLFQASPTATFLSRGEDSCLVDVNEAALKVFGYSRQEFIGHTSRELEMWANPGDYQINREKLVQGGLIRDIELPFRTKTGSIGQGLVSAEIIELEGKVHILTSLQDITERKAAEEALQKTKEQLRQSQKMETIGRIAGGVAHDFNNILTGIMGYAELMLMRLDVRDPMVPNIKEIQKAVDRAANLTSQLLAVSRSQVLQPKVLNLNDLVENISQLLKRVIGEDIVLITRLNPQLGNLKADPTQMEQILLNLAVNARDAMPTGGRLIFETSNIELDEGYSLQHFEAQPGSYIMLAITDTGTGMSKETLAHIFEPFFTTKQPGKGTGLGLATVYGIVKQSGGFVNVYSEEQLGTTFKIYLPRENEMALTEGPNVKVVEPGEGGGGSGETILLVEDDDMLREVTAISLETNGYKVITADGPQEAIRIVEGHEEPIQMVITDMIMPGMNGRELARRLLQLKPGLRLAYISGYTGESFGFEGEFEVMQALIEKPYTTKQLLKKVRQILYDQL